MTESPLPQTLPAVVVFIVGCLLYKVGAHTLCERVMDASFKMEGRARRARRLEVSGRDAFTNLN